MAAPAKAKVDFDPLTKDNYQIWINHVKDFLFEYQSMNFYDASELRGDESKANGDPDDYAEPAFKNDKGRVAWAYIRRHLTEDIYQKTLQIELGNVTKLLRALRLDWHDQSTLDRANLRDVYYSMKLDDYADFDAYILAFDNHVQLMKKYKVGSLGNDEDILHQFQRGLPDAWDTHTNTVLAQGLSYDKAVAYYKTVAKRYINLPGSTARSVNKTDKAATITEVCRNFAKGKCFRQNCRYLHVNAPAKQPQQANKPQ